MTCDCDPTLGHACCPPWMDANEWPNTPSSRDELHGCKYDQEDALKSGSGGVGSTDRTLTHASPGQRREVGYP